MGLPPPPPSGSIKPVSTKRLIWVVPAILVLIVACVAGYIVFFSGYVIRLSGTHTYYVEVKCDANWTYVAVFGARQSHSYPGQGTEEFTISWSDSDSDAKYITTLQIAAAKTYTSLFEQIPLNVELLDPNRNVVASGNTTDPFGVVYVTYQIPK